VEIIYKGKTAQTESEHLLASVLECFIQRDLNQGEVPIFAVQQNQEPRKLVDFESLLADSPWYVVRGRCEGDHWVPQSNFSSCLFSSRRHVLEYVLTDQLA